jgi:hypothetical protein
VSCTTSDIFGRAVHAPIFSADGYRRRGRRTLIQEFFQNLRGILVHFLERAAYFPYDALNLRCMTACTPLEQSHVVPRDIFDHLRETRVFPQTISVQLPHMWAKQMLMGLFGSEKGGDNALLNVTQEPQIRYVPHASEDIDKLVPSNESHTEERSAGSDFGVVQIPNVGLGPVQDGEYRCITGRCRSNRVTMGNRP